MRGIHRREPSLADVTQRISNERRSSGRKEEIETIDIHVWAGNRAKLRRSGSAHGGEGLFTAMSEAGRALSLSGRGLQREPILPTGWSSALSSASNCGVAPSTRVGERAPCSSA